MPSSPIHFWRPLLGLALIGSALAGEDPSPGETEFQRVLSSFGQINTIAGNGAGDNCNDWNSATMEGGQATSADLSRPHMAQADAAGNVYIADKEGHAIRLVKPDGTIHTIAGSGARGNGGEGVATSIALREPNGLYTFPDGTTYILETDDECDVGPHRRRQDPPPRHRRDAHHGHRRPRASRRPGLWVSPDESLIYYCSGKTVKKWTASGGIETFASGFGLLGQRAWGISTSTRSPVWSASPTGQTTLSTA